MPRLDQSQAPFFDSLVRARAGGPVSFHMPGHKFRPTLLPEFSQFFGEGVFSGDLNECLPNVDYLHAASGALAEAQALAAAAVGAEQTFFLVNGSTVGNQAMLLAAAPEGRPVIVPRNAHRSVFAGLALSGAVPVYVLPRCHPQVGAPLAVEVAAVRQALAAHPQASALHVTSPNYYGYLPDLAGLVGLAHEYGLPLLVDEAHGAHLPFHPDLPASAVQQGADLVVQSPHKTLGALTQAALLHLCSQRVSAITVQHVLALLQSSSPSVLLTASLDVARRLAAGAGGAAIGRAIELAQQARAAIRMIPGLWCYGEELIGETGIAAHDPTKLVIRVSEAGYSGQAFAAELWARFALGVEFADTRHVICSLSLADDAAQVTFLLDCLRSLAQKRPAAPAAQTGSLTFDYPALPRQALTPRQAMFRPGRVTGLRQAAGEICAEQVIPYPPGIPLLMPGEVIEAEMLDYLERLLALGIKVIGLADASHQSIRVLA